MLEYHLAATDFASPTENRKALVLPFVVEQPDWQMRRLPVLPASIMIAKLLDGPCAAASASKSTWNGKVQSLWKQPRGYFATWEIPSPDGRHLAMSGISAKPMWMIDHY